MKNFKMKYKNTYQLTELPWFEMNADGKPVLTLDDAPPIVDFHVHLGAHYFLSKPIDLYKSAPEVKHSFREKELGVDLEVYSGINLKNERRNGTFADHAHTVFTRNGANSTYTVPNIIEEMDRLGVIKSVVLSIDFPFPPSLSKYHLENTVGHPRFVPFCGINPNSPHWERDMQECLELGARGLKVHPYFCMMPPNHPKVLRMLGRWSRTGLPVLFHTSNNGLEPSVWRKWSDIELYEEPLKRFPGITFILGHAGMTFYEQAAAFAKAHGNTYLEIGGQPPQNIRHMIELLGNDKILFGTDWPFYPLILPLAKTLIATEDDPESRRKILSANAFRLYDELALANTGGRVDAQERAAV